jgi:hypothetical protein
VKGAAALALVLSPLIAEAAEPPPPGKYQCYQPPAFRVTAWLELRADGSYRAHAQPEGRYVYEGQTRQVRWLDGYLAGRFALHQPPGPDSPRHTLVFGADGKTRAKALQGLEQCYLTTH